MSTLTTLILVGLSLLSLDAIVRGEKSFAHAIIKKAEKTSKQSSEFEGR